MNVMKQKFGKHSRFREAFRHWQGGPSQRKPLSDEGILQPKRAPEYCRDSPQTRIEKSKRKSPLACACRAAALHHFPMLPSLRHRSATSDHVTENGNTNSAGTSAAFPVAGYRFRPIRAGHCFGLWRTRSLRRLPRPEPASAMAAVAATIIVSQVQGGLGDVTLNSLPASLLK